MTFEILRFLSISVLPILVLGLGYIILKKEQQKRILSEEKKGHK